MNIQLNAEWAAFKAHLTRTVGFDEAGNWLRFAAGVLDMEAKRRRQPIDGKAHEVRQERAL